MNWVGSTTNHCSRTHLRCAAEFYRSTAMSLLFLFLWTISSFANEPPVTPGTSLISYVDDTPYGECRMPKKVVQFGNWNKTEMSEGVPCIQEDFDGNSYFDFAFPNARLQKDVTEVTIIFFDKKGQIKEQKIELPRAYRLYLANDQYPSLAEGESTEELQTKFIHKHKMYRYDPDKSEMTLTYVEDERDVLR